jgi:hypothetical protein
MTSSGAKAFISLVEHDYAMIACRTDRHGWLRRDSGHNSLCINGQAETKVRTDGATHLCHALHRFRRQDAFQRRCYALAPGSEFSPTASPRYPASRRYKNRLSAQSGGSEGGVAPRTPQTVCDGVDGHEGGRGGRRRKTHVHAWQRALGDRCRRQGPQDTGGGRTGGAPRLVPIP